MTAPLHAASLFAGCGGSSLGHRGAGFRVVYANELDRNAADAYRLNHPDAHLDTRSVVEVSGADVLAHVPGGELDLLDGSPPCQDFSAAGRRDMRGDNARLLHEYPRLVGECAPRAFVAEQVPALASGAAKEHLRRFLADLRGHGYDVAARQLDASWLGVPQARRRLIFVGFRSDLGLSARSAFPRPHDRQAAIRDALPHVRRLVRLARSSWPEPDFWPASGPAPTVTKGGLSYWSPEHWRVETADGERHQPTVEEARALCGFPEGFHLPGSWREQWARLGNAVPPPMMRAVSERVAAALRSTDEGGGTIAA